MLSNDCVRIVLVEPEQARNIGSVVRVAANFGLGAIHVVRNPLSADDRRDVGVASAGATDHVQVRECRSLKEALRGAAVVVGTSARGRNVAVPTGCDLRSLLLKLNGSTMGGGGEVAVVFGRESQGLSSEELAVCHGVLSLPVSKKFSSMNLSHAVAVVLCQGLWNNDGDGGHGRAGPETGNAALQSGTAADEARRELKGLLASRDLQEAWLEQVASAAGGSPRVDVQQLRYLLFRAGPTREDMALLFNMIKL